MNEHDDYIRIEKERIAQQKNRHRQNVTAYLFFIFALLFIEKDILAYYQGNPNLISLPYIIFSIQIGLLWFAWQEAYSMRKRKPEKKTMQTLNYTHYVIRHIDKHLNVQLYIDDIEVARIERKNVTFTHRENEGRVAVLIKETNDGLEIVTHLYININDTSPLTV